MLRRGFASWGRCRDVDHAGGAAQVDTIGGVVLPPGGMKDLPDFR